MYTMCLHPVNRKQEIFHLKCDANHPFFVTTVGFMHTSFRYIAESGTCVEMQMRQALFTMFTLKKKSQNFRDV